MAAEPVVRGKSGEPVVGRVLGATTWIGSAGAASEGGVVAYVDGAEPLAGPGLAGLRVRERQRGRILDAAVEAFDEVGYDAATVSQIVRSACLSRRVFYDLFEGREACLLAILEGFARGVSWSFSQAGLARLAWPQRVRGALEIILGHLDGDPSLGRVCVVESLRGGPQVLERRAELMRFLARALETGAPQPAGSVCGTSVAAEAMVGAAHGVLYARLLTREDVASSALVGDLVTLVTLPYLGPDQARARAKVSMRRPPQLAPVRLRPAESRGARARLQAVPMRYTHRTAMVLASVAARPGATNRQLADDSGVRDEGQMSKLLARLQRLGLIVNETPEGLRNMRNAWCLTPDGQALLDCDWPALAAPIAG